MTKKPFTPRRQIKNRKSGGTKKKFVVACENKNADEVRMIILAVTDYTIPAASFMNTKTGKLYDANVLCRSIHDHTLLKMEDIQKASEGGVLHFLGLILLAIAGGFHTAFAGLATKDQIDSYRDKDQGERSWFDLALIAKLISSTFEGLNVCSISISQAWEMYANKQAYREFVERRVVKATKEKDRYMGLTPDKLSLIPSLREGKTDEETRLLLMKKGFSHSLIFFHPDGRSKSSSEMIDI